MLASSGRCSPMNGNIKRAISRSPLGDGVVHRPEPNALLRPRSTLRHVALDVAEDGLEFGCAANGSEVRIDVAVVPPQWTVPALGSTLCRRVGHSAAPMSRAV